MKIEPLLTDDAILQELGHRLTRRRLELQLTQAELAEESGVSKRTVERLEAGETTQISTMIRVLRVLGLIDRLDALVPEPGLRPIDLLELKGKERRRAPRRKEKKKGDPGGWTWGDES